MTKSKTNPLASIIIIDYKIENPYLVESLRAIGKQTYQNYEVILLTDYPAKVAVPRLRKKSYGHYVGPAEKRDDGAWMAKGEILAFIDNDAYPHTNWLLHLVKAFMEPSIMAVGGPGVTPPGVSWQETASGWMSASPLGAGIYTYRFLAGKRQFVDDYPSMNLAVRKADFIAVGGFDSHYWPGEDTKLCLDLVYQLNKKILYEPTALVYHHRRPLWIPHLRQHGNFGLHRGYFAKVLPQTSLKPIYFGPSLMTLGTIYLVIATLFPATKFSWLYEIGAGLLVGYLVAIILNAWWVWRNSRSLWQGSISMPSVLITHWWYGLMFLRGLLFSRHLTR